MLSVIVPDQVFSAAMSGAAAMQPEMNRTNARCFIPPLYLKKLREFSVALAGAVTIAS